MNVITNNELCVAIALTNSDLFNVIINYYYYTSYCKSYKHIIILNCVHIIEQLVS